MLLRPHLSFLLVIALFLSIVSCDRPGAAPTCTGQTVRLITKNVLTFGTDFAYPPFAFDDPQTREPTGFEVELANALVDQLGVKLLLVNRTSAALIPGLLAYRHDVAASALIDTPELRRELCVTTPYLAADLGLLARSGEPPSVTGVDDLDDRIIGVTKGGRGELWARDHAAADMKILRFDTSDDVLGALRGNEVDGIVDDLPFLARADVRGPDVSVVARITTDDDYVLAVAPDNAGLRDLLNDALRRLRANGKLETLRGRWFGE